MSTQSESSSKVSGPPIKQEKIDMENSYVNPQSDHKINISSIPLEKKTEEHKTTREIIVKPKVTSQVVKLLPKKPVKQQKTLLKPVLFRQIPKPTVTCKDNTKSTAKAKRACYQGMLDKSQKNEKVEDKVKDQKASMEGFAQMSKSSRTMVEAELKSTLATTSASGPPVTSSTNLPQQATARQKQEDEHSASRQLTDIVRMAFGPESKNEYKNRKIDVKSKPSDNKSPNFSRKRKANISNPLLSKDTYDFFTDDGPLDSGSNTSLADLFDHSYGSIPDLYERSQADFMQDLALSAPGDIVGSVAEGDATNPTVIIPNAYMIQSGLQRTFDMAAFQPFLDEAQNSVADVAQQGKNLLVKEAKVSNSPKVRDYKSDKEKAEACKKNKDSKVTTAPVAQRLKVLRQRNFELMTSQMFNNILQKWEEYLSMSPKEMQSHEINNGHLHNYNEDAMAMLYDADLNVWNIINDMRENIDFDLLCTHVM